MLSLIARGCFQRISQVCGNFWRREQGSAATEYALFIALLGGGVMLAADGLKTATRETFDGVGTTLAGTGPIRVEELDALKMETIPSSTTESSTIAIVGNQVSRLASNPHLISGVLFLLVGIGILFALRRTRVQQEVIDKLSNIIAGDDDDSPLLGKRQHILRMLCHDTGTLLENRLSVRHVMSDHIVTISPETSATEAAELMLKKQVRHLLVTDAGGGLLGVISDRDVARRVARKAAQLMTKHPICVSPNTLISPAVTLLMNHRISCLPVLEDGKIRGVLTSTDLMMTLQCAIQALQRCDSAEAAVAAELSSGPVLKVVSAG